MAAENQDKSIAQKYSFVDEAFHLFEEVLTHPEPTNITELWTEHLHIRNVMDNIRRAQAVLSDTDARLASAERTEEKREKLLQWAKYIGVELRNVDVELRDGEFAMKAKSDLNVDDVIVRVPRSATLNTDQARKSTALRKAIERDSVVEMGNISLALHVCVHWMNGESSRWHPYLEALPRTLNSPLFFNIEELLCLKPSKLFKEALTFYRVISRQFTYFLFTIASNGVYERNQKLKSKKDRRPQEEPPIFYNTPFTINNFTLNLYMWAVGVVTTRINLIPSNFITKSNGEPDMIPALIPVFDMVNHEFIDSTAESVSFCAEDDVAEIKVSLDWKAGDEVKINYGKRTNLDHLLHNGFVPRGKNPNNRYELQLGLPKSDKEYSRKMQLIVAEVEDYPPDASNVFVFYLRDAEEPFEGDMLLRFAKIFVTPNPSEETLLSDEAELKGIQFLKTRLDLILRSYGKDHFEDVPGRIGDINRLKNSEIAAIKATRIKLESIEASLKEKK